ncbi:MAG: pyruvate kinase [Patescibacteria group bacterium]|nr:pyruvate kinase [Candidatus Saccharibacteria bacterium]MDQ5963157.1 pyruvate kinase [Patescibacteria group bacterium]
MADSKKRKNVSLSEYKRTKIIATVGPSTNSYKQIKALIDAGANGIRLNFSHGTHEERVQQIAWIRKASHETGKPIAIIQDLQGPKIRLGDFDGVVPVQKGQSLRLQFDADYAATGILPTQYDLAKKVKRGERLLLADGRLHTHITSVKDGTVHVRTENDGVLLQRKGINLPDTDFEGDVITAKDRADLAFGSEQDIDYVAMSFIQTPKDIRAIKRIIHNLGSPRAVIAKIETKMAVENLEEIIQEADAIMVARGDLAVETLPESVPIVQRKIIGLGLKHRKPTVVATQMLASMTEAPEPTRAEVSDIATAVLVGADCVMLSDETASGRYPVEAVEVMKRVIMYTQSHPPLHTDFSPVFEPANTKELAISRGVISLANSIQAKAIVAETKTGATAVQIACERPGIPVIAVTDVERTANQLAIVFDIKSYVRPAGREAATKMTDFLQKNKVFKKGDIIVTASGQYPGVVGTTDTIKVRQLL